MESTDRAVGVAQEEEPVTVPAPRFGNDVLRDLAGGLDHPEAVCWSPGREALLAGGEAGQLYRIGLDGRVDELVRIPDAEILGLAVDADDTVYACDTGHGRIARITTAGAVDWTGPTMTYPNYPAFDAQGVLWVSDSGRWGQHEGRLVGIAPDGTTHAVHGQWAFANGVAVVDRRAYLVASGDPAVWAVDLDDGTAEVVVRLPRTVPDGVAFDADGGLWISCYQPNRVFRLDADGTLETVLDDWSGEELLSPTNLAFAGPGLRTVVLASLCGRTVRSFDAGVAGRPLYRPALQGAV